MKQPKSQTKHQQRQGTDGSRPGPRSDTLEGSTVRVTRRSASLTQGKRDTLARYTKSDECKTNNAGAGEDFSAPQSEEDVGDQARVLSAKVQGLSSGARKMKGGLRAATKNHKRAKSGCEKCSDDWNAKWKEREAQFSDTIHRVRLPPTNVGFPPCLLVLLVLVLVAMTVATFVLYQEHRLCRSKLEFLLRHWNTPVKKFGAAFGLEDNSNIVSFLEHR
ncbi:hypothetical protein TWF788_008252 [Orbilia oligospora]|uniref:Uncharacterized protein n=1 Tax=Orbilia oligospora TaxID=2813651 RepID=A0A7C8Q398_ORBOL|nr:hypothetical protein TWF788_008252 [Orbilia oligospora]